MLNDLSLPITLKFGTSAAFSCEMDAARVSVLRPGPPARRDVTALADLALASPIDMPALHLAVVPDDKVAIVLDRETPAAAEIVLAVWKQFEMAGINPANIHILHPAALSTVRPSDPRTQLPPAVRSAVGWHIHDPTVEGSCSYLATTAGGERIYLAKELVEADFVLPIAATAYDPLLGYRSASSIIYPGLSTVEAMRRAIGIGHEELPPSSIRPLRQIADEITWLMGIPLAVQIIAADRGVLDVVAGSCEGVARHCRAIHDDHWLVNLPQRVDTVVAAVPCDLAGHGWAQIGRALATARQIVEHGGRIIILSELEEPPGEGVEFLRRFEEADEALQPLRAQMPLDLLPATQLASAATRARIYLLSRLPGDLISDLFMYPLDSLEEVDRLLQTGDSIAFLGSAQNTFGIVD